MDNTSLINELEEKIQNFLQQENLPEAIETYIELGRYYQRILDTPKGLTQYDLANKLAQQMEDVEMQSKLAGLIGSALKEIGNLQDASRHLKKSRRLAEDIGNRVLELDANIHLSMVMVERGKQLEAISILDNALMLALSIKETRRMMNISDLMGKIFLGMESIDKALEHFSTSLEAARKLKSIPDEIKALINLGLTLMQDGIYDGAIEQLENALDLADQIKDPYLEIRVLNGLMHANLKSDRSRLGLMYGEQMVNKVMGVDNLTLQIRMLYDFGQSAFQCGKYEDAIQKMEQGIRIAQTSKEEDWEFKFQKLAGFAAFESGQIDQAETFFQAALEHAAHFRKLDEKIIILGQLSAIAVENGNLDQAITYNQESLAIARGEEDQKAEAQQLVLLALNLFDNGEKEEAIIEISAAIKIFKDLELVDLLEHAQNYLDGFQGA